MKIILLKSNLIRCIFYISQSLVNLTLKSQTRRKLWDGGCNILQRSRDIAIESHASH